MKNAPHKLVIGVALIGSVMFGVNSVGAASDDLMPNERQKADYVNYCAPCHGVGGEGNGPMASELKAKPANLTLLSKENGGVFPYTKLRNVIDGSYKEGNFRAHGSKEMPIWGDVFRRQAGGSFMAAQARIMNILDYIEMFQYD